MSQPRDGRRPRAERCGRVTILTLSAASLPGAALAGDLKGAGPGPRGGHLLLDFSRVRRVTGAGLGALVALHKRMAAAGGRLTLFNLADEVYEVFALTGLHSLLSICREGPPPLPTSA